MVTVHLSFRQVARLFQKRLRSIPVLNALGDGIVNRTKDNKNADKHGENGEETAIVV